MTGNLLTANAAGWHACGFPDGRVQLFSCGTSITLGRPEFDVLLNLLETAWAKLCNDAGAHDVLCQLDESHHAHRCADCGTITVGIGLKNQCVRMNEGGLQSMLALCRDTLLALEGVCNIDLGLEPATFVLHPPTPIIPSLN